MIKDNFLIKWFIGCFIYLLFFSVCCWVFYSKTTSKIEKDQLSHETMTQQESGHTIIKDIQTDKTSLTNNLKHITDDNNHAQPAENEVIYLPQKKVTKYPLTNSDLDTPLLPDINQNSTDVSPHGLGPYPILPIGWNPNTFNRDLTIGQELIERVRIKLFNEGTNSYGGIRNPRTGLVYPITLDLVYIKWGQIVLPSRGSTKYAMSIRGHPDIVTQIRETARTRLSDLPEQFRPITENDISSSVKILTDSDGIDPYEFLNLDRQ